MPASARKPADAAPADEAAPAAPGSAAQVAEQAPTADAPTSPAVEEFRGPVTVVFHGQAQSAVAGVGLCEPGESYTVPAALADALQRSGFFAPAAE